VRDGITIGVDVGGTKILAGVIDRSGRVGDTVEIPTPTESQDVLLEGLESVIQRLMHHGPAAIGIGLPCNLDRRTGVAFRATNLPLRDLDPRGWAAGRFDLPVAVENDGNAATLAEWRLGAGRDVDNLVMLTLGTGVGGGLVLDRTLYRGWAEVGHVVVDFDGVRCQGNCHGRGHLEGVVSGHAADAVGRELFGHGADGATLVERARAGDERALAALDRMGRLLGAAIGSLVNLFDPELIVVGGGFGAAAGELLLEPARASAAREAIQPADERIRIVPAELGGEAGLVGAALVGFDALDGMR
jgi:glucokinase